MAKGEGLGGLLVLGEPSKDEKSEPEPKESEATGKAAMSAASAAAMGAMKRSDAQAFQSAMRELFHAFMLAGPKGKK